MGSVASPTTAVVRVSATVNVSEPPTVMSVETVLKYSMKDPYEVQISFQTPSGPQVVWRFARELLMQAHEEGEAGAGDIAVAWDHDSCIIKLHGARNVTAEVELPARRIGIFLNKILSMVPMGQEYRHYTIPDFLPTEWL